MTTIAILPSPPQSSATQSISEHQESPSPLNLPSDYDVETEGLITQLCDLDVSGHGTDTLGNHPNDINIFLGCVYQQGFSLLLGCVKRDMHACKDVIAFLKKRAIIEEEYSKGLLKATQGAMEVAEKSEYAKQGILYSFSPPIFDSSSTFAEVWFKVLSVHQRLAENRLKFAQSILEVSDDLQAVLKETERSRKQLKEIGIRQERAMHESEQLLEKSKMRYDTLSEDWEKTILLKNGEAPKKSLGKPMKLFKGNKSPEQLQKMEEDARAKAALSKEHYKTQLAQTNQARHEFFNVHLPRILTSLIEASDECTMAVQYQLTRYAFMCEQSTATDGKILDGSSTANGGLRALAELMDGAKDLKGIVRQSSRSPSAHSGKFGHSEIPYTEYTMSHQAMSIINPRPTFGVDLASQLERDELEIPHVLVKCTKAIEEKGGLKSQGIYRLSGTSTQVNKMKAAFDRDAEKVDLTSQDYADDVNNIASLLKLFFRELPDPLLTHKLYPEFIQSSKIEDGHLRLIALHETVNRLPDPNYATLSYLMRHLDRVQQHSDENKMTISNLAIVWGPTLLGLRGDDRLTEMQFQCKVVEVVLENYRVIFESEE
ncbi:uncharacterized protein VTP21DRAFT_5865 [Calcarisporiella thermophila]|uniref:uncharacterized protein n=1 Tax=Calcarisporiella thermophila TaxID=911321 RepID=UPI0037441AA0